MHTTFSYAVDLWLVDLDNVTEGVLLSPWIRFDARDHLGAPGRSIKDNVLAWLGSAGIDLAGGRVLMLAAPRFAGYVFNPLSVYWCYDRDGEQRAVIAEVHNTYGERHAYLLQPDDAGRARVEKAFYVSPFFTVEGHYLMRIGQPEDQLHLTIALRQGGTTPFTATLAGRRTDATPGAALASLLRHPLGGYRISALIYLQGVKLYLRKVPVIKRWPHIRQEGV